MTEGQTDRIPLASTALCIVSNAERCKKNYILFLCGVGKVKCICIVFYYDVSLKHSNAVAEADTTAEFYQHKVKFSDLHSVGHLLYCSGLRTL